MNTPIIKISDDQKTITHESGVVTVFEQNGNCGCKGCVYKNRQSCADIPCIEERRIKMDCEGIFKLKQP